MVLFFNIGAIFSFLAHCTTAAATTTTTLTVRCRFAVVAKYDQSSVGQSRGIMLLVISTPFQLFEKKGGKF